MTTFYHCDFIEDISLSDEEKERITKQRIKDHKKSVRALKKILGQNLSDSEDENQVVDEIKNLSFTFIHDNTKEDDKQSQLNQ